MICNESDANATAAARASTVIAVAARKYYFLTSMTADIRADTLYVHARCGKTLVIQ